MDDKVTVSTYQFLKQFSDAEAARLYLEARRWGGKPVCPHCAEAKRIQTRKLVGYYRCLACKVDFTVRTGTIFERSHIPLDKWLYAMYLMATARKGVSSLQISKELGITQKSAWFMMQRIREACGNYGKGSGGGGMLSGIVEADETYIGGKEKNKHASKKLRAGRGTIGKAIVMGMRERGGRVRATVIQNTSAEVIQTQVVENIAPGSTLCTDEHSSYKGMPWYTHLAVRHGVSEFVNGMAHTNGIESMWAILKLRYHGTFHHFSVEHLQRYVNEFSYRLNEGNCKVHTMDRIDALIARTPGARITYSELIGNGL